MDLVKIGAGFDLISPVIAIVGNMLNGPHHTFMIPFPTVLSGHDIARLLRRRNIRCWGKIVVNDTFMISVKLDQARYANSVLEQAGVPVSNPPDSPQSSRQPRRAQGRQSGLTEAAWRIFDIFE